ncbi:MAG: BON domain-containing protein [Gammaproteobacteria bacterium]|nr:BON domain-containing protein [Gammaproteobacteria bacterium]
MLRRIWVGVFFACMMQLGMAAADIQGMKQHVSDVVITAKIDAKLAKWAKVNPFKLTISTKNGVVTLKGYVPDKKRFADVLHLVKTTKGVKAVRIEGVKIQAVNMSITDAYITAKVETAILKAKVLDDESIPLVGISAHTVNGVVTLSGFVKQKTSIRQIVKRVYAVKGVRLVIVKLKQLK